MSHLVVRGRLELFVHICAESEIETQLSGSKVRRHGMDTFSPRSLMALMVFFISIHMTCLIYL